MNNTILSENDNFSLDNILKEAQIAASLQGALVATIPDNYRLNLINSLELRLDVKTLETEEPIIQASLILKEVYNQGKHFHLANELEKLTK